jgi:hypothetical protein
MSSNYTGTATVAPTETTLLTATSLRTLTTAPSAVSQVTVTGKPSIYGQITVSELPSTTAKATTIFCYGTQSYSIYVTPTPVQGPAFVSTHQPMQEQDSFIIGVTVGGGIVVFVFIMMMMEILQKTNKRVLTSNVTNPLIIHAEPVIENGKMYFRDKPNGLLLAEGWKRFQDGNDVWYSNGKSSSWLPIYK